MTTTFTGEVRIPGSIENGLPSTITLDPQTVILTAGGTELGRWNRTDLVVSREPDGAFRLALGREIVLFNPDSPLEFAILSGMPGAATAPTPTAPPPAPAPAPPAAAPVAPVAASPSEAAPPAVAPQPAAAVPVAAPPPVAAVPPVAAAPPPVPAATAAAPPAAAPPPAVVPPSAATPPPAAPTPTPVAAPPVAPAPAAGEPPPVAPDTYPGAEAGQTSGLPPAPPAAAAAAAAAASVATVPTQPGPVEIRLETDNGAAPPPAAPVQETPSPAAPAQETSLAAGSVQETPPAGSGDFWDGFHEEEREAGVQPPIAPEATAAHASPEIQLETPEDGAADESSQVGGWGSGLFTEGDDGEPAYPPAFGGSGDTIEGEDRSGSFYEGDSKDENEDESEDRGWSYDDPKPEEPTEDEDPPAFKSPAADRDDLVEKSSRLRDAAAWRPSMPSISLGGSSLGMRARGVLEVLDAVLEENGTEDIPRSFLVGLLSLVGVLALIALIAFIF